MTVRMGLLVPEIRPMFAIEIQYRRGRTWILSLRSGMFTKQLPPHLWGVQGFKAIYIGFFWVFVVSQGSK